MLEQCDLTRPSCLRCVKYGKACPGYRDASDIAFKHEDIISLKNSYGRKARKEAVAAISCPQARQKAASGKDLLTTLAKNEHVVPQREVLNTIHERQSSPLTPMYNVLSQTLSAHAAPLILHQYSAAVPGCGGNSWPRIFGYHSFLPTLLRRQDENCLSLAVEAWADAYMSNQSQATLKADYRPSTYYGKALRAVNKSLRNSEESSKDTTLAAIWVLGNYEVST